MEAIIKNGVVNKGVQSCFVSEWEQSNYRFVPGSI